MKLDREHYGQIHLSARRMRANPTKAENALWQALRNSKLGGLKFRRQTVIGPFIADFYCAAAKLVVEVDGDVHDYQKDVDAVRSRQFEDYGYHVIRFSNKMVLNQLDEALTEIEVVAMERITALTPYPSPNSGRGVQGHGLNLSLNAERGEQARGADFSPESGGGDDPLPQIPREGAGG